MVMFKVYDGFKIFFTCLIYTIDMKKNIVVHIKIITFSLLPFLLLNWNGTDWELCYSFQSRKLEDHQGQLPST